MVAVVLLAAVATAAAVLTIADRHLYATFVAHAAANKTTAGVQAHTIVTDEDLNDLPEPMIRYLRWSGVQGKRRISAVRLVHSGTFKLGRDKPWMPIRGEYYVTTMQPTFTWYGKLRMAPGLTAVALDSYASGQGRMLVKLLSAVTIVDDQSEQISRSAFGRCVAELAIMAPTFFLDRARVRCTQSGPDSVRCTVTDDGFSTDADFIVHPDGSLDRVVVTRYFDRGDGLGTLESFTGKCSQPKSYTGIMLGSRVDGFWNLAEGDFHYVSFTVDSVEFQ